MQQPIPKQRSYNFAQRNIETKLANKRGFMRSLLQVMGMHYSLRSSRGYASRRARSYYLYEN